MNSMFCFIWNFHKSKDVTNGKSLIILKIRKNISTKNMRTCEYNIKD